MSLPDVYMVSVKNLPDIFSAVRQAGVPDRFNNEYLKQLGFTSSNDRSFPVVLKTLGFLDDNLVPTERYRRYRDSSISGAVMAEALRDAYSDLFKINEKAQGMSATELTGAFKRITGKTESVSAKMGTTFKALTRGWLIANACLQAESERRTRQWQALERLSELSTPAPGYMREDLTREQSLPTVGSLLELGWWSAAPEDPDEE